MKKIQFIGLLLTLLSFSSCAMHQGYMVNSASLSSANFNYVGRDIQGQSSVTYIFGFGGFLPESLISEAKKDMLGGITLKDNQTIANLSVNYKTVFVYPFVIKVICTVTADVIEFKEPKANIESEQISTKNKVIELNALFSTTLNKDSDLRKTPDQDGEKIIRIPVSSLIYVLEKGDIYYKVQYQNTQGYISKYSLVKQE